MASRDSGARPALSSAEFDLVLRNAEELLTTVDRARDRLRRFLVVETLSVAALITAGLGLLAIALPNPWLVAMMVGCVGLAVVGVVRVLHSGVQMPARGEIYRDEKVMVRTVSMLREILPLLSEDEDWSLIRVEQARMRLGRFPIEPRGL